MVRLLKPQQVYLCPKDGSYVDDDWCRNCHNFVKAEWHEGEWTIFCDHPADQFCSVCGKPLTVVAYGKDYKIIGCPEHREFDQIIPLCL
jgi:hypothetical protein